MVAINRLRELLNYDPETGVLTWRETRGGNAVKGQMAGTLHINGYTYIVIERKKYMAHRLAWRHVHGEWPEGEVDHINRQKSDNRLTNLRVVDHSTNNKNKYPQSNNTSGCPGVYWSAIRNKWVAQIAINGRTTHLGIFAEYDAAVAARKAAEPLHGYVSVAA
jgi:hypothetical protein